MSTRATLIVAVAMLAAIVACSVPGATPPTAFVLPTPNQTLTAIFAPTSAATLEPPPTTEATTTIAVTPVVTQAGLPSSTVGPLSSRPNGSPVEADRLTTSPVIDGDLADWSTSAFNATQVVYGATRWSGLNDVSAVYYIGWDEANLYLGARVTDDKYVQVSSGSSLFLGDGLEIQLDANLAADFYTAEVDTDDYQVGLSAGNFAAISPQAYRWYPASLRGTPSGVVIAGKTSATGYNLEAKVPWTVFGLTPVTGARYGFALSVSDNDAAGTAAQQSMVSSVSTRTLLNPTTWGTLILVGGGS
jgi:Carbohydrate family 9 binding domain-like